MGPGPPPVGAWGVSQAAPGGGPDPMSPGQNHLSPFGFRIVFYIDFDIDLGSSWGRFGLRLGSHFRSCWRLDRPKLVPRPSSNRLNIEKVNFHETSAGVVPERLQGPKMAPKTAQDRPKTGPRSSWIGFFTS